MNFIQCLLRIHSCSLLYSYYIDPDAGTEKQIMFTFGAVTVYLIGNIFPRNTMSKANLVGSISIILALLVAACGGGDDGATNSDGTSEFNHDLEGDITSGEPGGDISRIAGLWNGSTNNASGSDVVYWHLAANGVLTRYDYQQDSGSAASGENCLSLIHI